MLMNQAVWQRFWREEGSDVKNGPVFSKLLQPQFPWFEILVYDFVLAGRAIHTDKSYVMMDFFSLNKQFCPQCISTL